MMTIIGRALMELFKDAGHCNPHVLLLIVQMMVLE